MPFAETIRTALVAVSANRLRAFLTILGVTIGVAAVIGMVSVGQGASDLVQSSLQGLGTNAVFVTPGTRSSTFIQSAAGGTTSINIDDLAALQRPGAIPDAVSFVPEQGGYAQLRAGSDTRTTRIVGTTPEYSEARDWGVQQGRFITSGDVLAAAPVAVIGPDTARELFGTTAAVDRSFNARYVQEGGAVNLRLKVIGVLEPKGNIAGFFNRDDIVLVPITTSQKRIFGRDSLGSITISAKCAAATTRVQDAAVEVLRKRHRLHENDPNDFTVSTQQDLLATAALTADVFTVLLGLIGGVSLVVGGIGIMNIMLVSVTERTREIGLRKALGARRRDILGQFLVEAVVLTSIGGALGILIALLFAVLISAFSPVQAIVTPAAVAVAALISVGVGLVFGLYPARRAALLQPITALRAE
jgi:putative ABC transport system permease protein